MTSDSSPQSSLHDTGPATQEEVDEVVWKIARFPTTDIQGMQYKAAVYLHYCGLEAANPSAAITAREAILASLLRDLLTGTADYHWLKYVAQLLKSPRPADDLHDQPAIPLDVAPLCEIGCGRHAKTMKQ